MVEKRERRWPLDICAKAAPLSPQSQGDGEGIGRGEREGGREEKKGRMRQAEEESREVETRLQQYIRRERMGCNEAAAHSLAMSRCN